VQKKELALKEHQLNLRYKWIFAMKTKRKVIWSYRLMLKKVKVEKRYCYKI
jgi:hypothetical protein